MKRTCADSTYAFVDASNIIYGVMKNEGWKVDLLKLFEYLEERYHASRVFYYGGFKPGNPEEYTLYENLRQIGYTVRKKRVMYYHEGGGRITMKANCDVDLTLDLVRYIPLYRRAVLLSGDGDFIPVIRYLFKKRRKVAVIANAVKTSVKIKAMLGNSFKDIRSLRHLLERK